ncbi:MAG: tryptophan synthase subunit alpha [Lentisphaerae bacterium]|nr:tryptophan synthase subunit alpha [Lentisphaerota bacterium]
MNRFEKTFAALSSANRKALIAYFTAGDPDMHSSFATLDAACKAGVDILELGVPFSDATSDGPVIQAAASRALANGATLQGVIDLAARLRAAHPDLPLVIFSYYNPILNFGLERLGAVLDAAGVDGLLIVDLPPEESAELTTQFGDLDLPLIRLVAPTTPPQRMATIADGAGGFIYLITRIGVTGSGTLDIAALARQAGELRKFTPLPICLGFGISTAADARQLGSLADGIIIGSALVALAHEAGEQAPQIVAERVAAIRAALDHN